MRELKKETKQTMSFSLDEARRRLEERRDALMQLREEQRVEREGLQEQVAQDAGDHAVREEGIDLLDHLDEGERHELRMIDAALMLVASGSYGTCVECSQAIEPARLQAVPYTLRCIECADPAVTSDEFARQEHGRNTL
jgi:DnaK suppressor protein